MHKYLLIVSSSRLKDSRDAFNREACFYRGNIAILDLIDLLYPDTLRGYRKNRHLACRDRLSFLIGWN